MSKKEQLRKKCSKCQKERVTPRQFYISDSDNHADGRYPVCKPCIQKDLDTKNVENPLADEFTKKLKDILLEMNRPYIHSVLVDSIEESKERNMELFGIILKNVNLNHRGKNWNDSEFDTKTSSTDNNTNNSVSGSSQVETNKDTHEDNKVVELNSQNKQDVLRLLGYDPFEYESETDRKDLFNKLTDYLTEDVLENGFMLSSVIEIVRILNQIDRVNAAIATAQISEFNSLVKTKETMFKIALNIAKDNGISVGKNHANSAGSGTLTGIMKQLQEYDITEAGFNLFDIETAQGIKQVADLSNKSIAEQLQFAEDDYSEMLHEQRELLTHFESMAKKYQEENRLLRVELEARNKIEEKLKQEIKEMNSRR